jgi:MFS family permease
MAIYGAGIPLGAAIGLAGGGLLAEALGWREVFWIFGLPGVIVALVVFLYVREPPRAPQSQKQGPSFPTVLKTLWSRRSFVHATLGTALLAFGGFAASLWLPSFLIRTHAMPIGIIGLSLAALTVVGGVSGTIIAGRLANSWVKRDRRYHMWVPAAAMLFGVPFSVIGLLIPAGVITIGDTTIPNWLIVLIVFLVPTAAGAAYIGPVMAAIQTMVAEPMRALTTAIFLFVTNLIGLGAGPAIVGWVSDLLKAQFGPESLRISLLIFVIVNVWAALHFWLASRHVRDDLKHIAEDGSDVS